jgi:hypothetical protein
MSRRSYPVVGSANGALYAFGKRPDRPLLGVDCGLMLRNRFSKEYWRDHRSEGFVRLALQRRILEKCFSLSRMEVRLTRPKSLDGH